MWDNVQIYYAAELGIGQADPAHIRVVDLGVPDFGRIMEQWR